MISTDGQMTTYTESMELKELTEAPEDIDDLFSLAISHHARKVKRTICRRRPRRRRGSGTESDQRIESEGAQKIIKIMKCCQNYVPARRLAGDGTAVACRLVNVWYICWNDRCLALGYEHCVSLCIEYVVVKTDMI